MNTWKRFRRSQARVAIRGHMLATLRSRIIAPDACSICAACIRYWHNALHIALTAERARIICTECLRSALASPCACTVLVQRLRKTRTTATQGPRNAHDATLAVRRRSACTVRVHFSLLSGHAKWSHAAPMCSAGAQHWCAGPGPAQCLPQRRARVHRWCALPNRSTQCLRRPNQGSHVCAPADYVARPLQ